MNVADAWALCSRLARAARRRAPRVGRYVVLQLLAQATTLATGLLLVRTLAKGEYGVYTLGASMLTLAGVLADAGLSAGMYAIGTRVWRDSAQVEALMYTALSLRRRFGQVVLAIILPLTALLLVTHGSSGAEVAAITALIGVCAYANYSVVTSSIGLKLRGEIARVQILDLLSAIVRFVIVLLALYARLDAATALAATMISTIVERAVALRWAGTARGQVDPAFRAEMIATVKRQLPQVSYFAMQGQLTVLIVATFAQGGALADVGALTRIGALFGVFSSMVSGIVAPAFSRCEGVRRLRAFAGLTVGGYAAMCGLILALAALAPRVVLLLLGRSYLDLEHELWLYCTLASVSGISSTIAVLNLARGWIDLTWLEPPLTIATQVAALYVIDVRSTAGALQFGIVGSLPVLALVTLMMLRGLRASTIRVTRPNPAPCAS